MKNLKHIQIKGCNNLCDIGGYCSKSGSIRWHCAYRCDLPMLSQNEWQTLYDAWNVRGVIDLRSTSETEIQSYPQSCSAIQYHHMPLINEEQSNHDAMNTFTASMAESYLKMVLNGAENICAILTKIASIYAQGGAVLYHCTAGKDRTGIISYILLSLCGVDKADIMADYQISSTYNFYGNSSGNKLLEQLSDKETEWMHSQPETLGILFNYFEKHDLVGFLIKHGMKESDIRLIQTYLQE